MKKISILVPVLAAFLLAACQTDIENIEIQKPLEFDDEYYENLRAYKRSDHQICFGWYAGYTSESSPSPGSHFWGLPDSMDIISLWAQIPSNDPTIEETNEYNERYLPIAYQEMHEMREKKGTRLVKAIICRIGPTEYEANAEGMRQYAMHLVEMVNRNNLDGLDLDFEPEGDWLDGDNFVEFVKIIGEHFGPMSGTDKLLIVDFYTNVPYSECEPYVNYFINQCYGAGSASSLQNTWFSRSKYRSGKGFEYLNQWCPPEKYIPTEQMGWYWQDGGVSFSEADGNREDSWGNPLYSVIGMARWNPNEGMKGGFGGYYFEYEYNTQRPAKASIGDTESQSIPYYSFRRGIQEQDRIYKEYLRSGRK